MLNSGMLQTLLTGILETLYMVVVSTGIAYIIGIPVGIVLYITFIVLLIAILPFTRAVVGTTIGSTATIVPLVVAASPFVARMVESSLKEVNAGVIEAAESMGATPLQIIWKVLLPEAKPSLIVGSAIAITTILGYSAMAGFTGGGGLGAIAINYGYYRYEDGVMLITVLILVVIVQIFQEVGMRVAFKTDKRIKR